MDLRVLIADPIGYGGGIRTLSTQLAGALLRAGHSVLIASPVSAGENEEVLWPDPNDELSSPAGLALLKAQGWSQRLGMQGVADRAGARRRRLHAQKLGQLCVEHEVDHCIFVCVVDFVPPRLPVPMSIVVHDLNWNFYPDNFPGRSCSELNGLVAEWLRECEWAFCNSDTTRAELVSQFPWANAKAVSAPIGYSPRPKSSDQSDRTVASRLAEKRFLLYPATMGSHKGHADLLRAFGRVAERLGDVSLVLAGHRTREIAAPADAPNHALRLARESYLGLPPETRARILGLGSVSDATLDWLYGHCAMVVLPTEYEGFGLPLLEAWGAKANIVATDIPAFNEQIRRYRLPARLVTPKDPVALAAAILDGLSTGAVGKIDPALLSAWTWDDSARIFLDRIQSRSEAVR